MSKVIMPYEIEETLGTELSSLLRRDVLDANMKYSEVGYDEFMSYITTVQEALRTDIPTAGEHRRADWEYGWEENLRRLRASHNLDGLMPLYHGKHALMRWRGRMIDISQTPNMNYLLHRIIVDWAIETWLSHVDSIMEFGCGPAYHLLRARRLNPTAKLIGLDWAESSQDIIQEIVKLGIETNITGHNFDFYNPDYSLEMPPNSGVLTVAALEQVGDRFKPFVWWLIRKHPTVCVNLEPIDELMDESNVIDRLSLQYCRKRNYLKGFLTFLRQLEKEKIIKIHTAQRTWEGSYFIEGHSLVVWSPVYGENNGKS